MSEQTTHDTQADSKPLVPSGRIGFLLFLGTEAMLFAGILAAYFMARVSVGTAWPSASTPIPAVGETLMKPGLGLANTVLLLAANFCVAAGAFRVSKDRAGAATRLFVVGLVMGAVFLGVKLYEYRGKVEHHLLPATADAVMPLGKVWSSYYFGLTGLHFAHVVVGLLMLTWLILRGLFGRLGTRQTVLAQNVASYWSLVDAVWLILFPLLYLM